MIITKLSARNFKGRSFDHVLGKINLFTGKNRTGKTARLEALSLAALGYVPAEPKAIRAERAIFDLYSSGNPLAVGFDTDGDLNVTRTWTETDGSVRYKGPDGTILPAIGFDPSVYLGISGPERLKFMCRATANGQPFDRETETQKLIAELKNVKLESNSRKTEKAIDETCEVIRKLKPGGLPVEWIDAMMEIARTRKAASDQSVKRMASTSQGITQAAAYGPPAPPPDADVIAQEKRDACQKISDEKVRLETLVSQARNEYRDISAKVLKGDLDAQVKITLTKINELEKLIGADFVPRTTSQMRDANRARRNASTESATALAARLEITSLTQELDASKKKTCSKCGHKLSPKATTKIKSEIGIKIESARKTAEKAEGLLANLEKEIAVADVFDKKEIATREIEPLKRILAFHKEACAALPGIRKKGEDLAEALKNVEAELTKATEAVMAAEKDEKLLLASRAERSTRSRVLETAETSQAEADIAKAFVEIVAAKQVKMVDDSIAPVISRMNEFCAELLPGPVWWGDGELKLATWTHRTTSDSEKLALYTALCISLAIGSPIKIALISRLEAFDFDGKAKLLRIIDGLIEAGKIDQCFLAEVDQSDGFDDGFDDGCHGGTHFGNLKVFKL